MSGAQAVEVLDAVGPAGHRLEGESNLAGGVRGVDPHMARCIQWVRACKVFLEVAQTISIGILIRIVGERRQAHRQFPIVRHAISVAVQSAADGGAGDRQGLGPDQIAREIIGQKIEPVRSENQRNVELPGGQRRPGER